MSPKQVTESHHYRHAKFVLKQFTHFTGNLVDPVCCLLQKNQRRFINSFEAKVYPNDALDFNGRMWDRKLCGMVNRDTKDGNPVPKFDILGTPFNTTTTRRSLYPFDFDPSLFNQRRVLIFVIQAVELTHYRDDADGLAMGSGVPRAGDISVSAWNVEMQDEAITEELAKHLEEHYQTLWDDLVR